MSSDTIIANTRVDTPPCRLSTHFERTGSNGP